MQRLVILFILLWSVSCSLVTDFDEDRMQYLDASDKANSDYTDTDGDTDTDADTDSDSDTEADTNPAPDTGTAESDTNIIPDTGTSETDSETVPQDTGTEISDTDTETETGTGNEIILCGTEVCTKEEICFEETCLPYTPSPNDSEVFTGDMGSGECREYGTLINNIWGVPLYSNGSNPYYGVYDYRYGLLHQCTTFAMNIICDVFGNLLSPGEDGGSKCNPELYKRCYGDYRCGHAKQWTDNEANNHILKDTTFIKNVGPIPPQPGDVIISDGGTHGHVRVAVEVSANPDDMYVLIAEQNMKLSQCTEGVRRINMIYKNGLYTVTDTNTYGVVTGWRRVNGALEDTAENHCKEICQNDGIVCGYHLDCNCGSCDTCENTCNTSGQCEVTPNAITICQNDGNLHIYDSCSVEESVQICSNGCNMTTDVCNPPMTCTEICSNANRICGSYESCNCGSCESCESCNSGQCEATSHNSSTCNSGDVYWYDSCSIREDMKDNCQTCETCSGSSCTATSHTSFACYNGDVYWYDSCSIREDMKDNCLDCEYCLSGTCEVQHYAYQICHTDGNIWFTDKCGNLEQKHEDCSNGCSTETNTCTTCIQICDNANSVCGNVDGCECGTCSGCASECNSGQCEPESNVSLGCHENNVWWMDSCGNPDTPQQSCMICAPCSGGECTPTSHAYSECDSNELYWFNLCDVREDMKQNCPGNCTSGNIVCDCYDTTYDRYCSGSDLREVNDCEDDNFVETCEHGCESGACIGCDEVCSDAGRVCGSYENCECGQCNTDCNNQCSTGGQCEPTAGDSTECDLADGNIHSYDSCGNDEGISETCEVTCDPILDVCLECVDICSNAGLVCGMEGKCDCGSCDSCETCEGGECNPTNPEDGQTCHEDDLYWLDSCDEIAELKEACEFGCDEGNDECNSEPVDPCISACAGKECGNGGITGCDCGSCSGTDICENGNCVCYDITYDQYCSGSDLREVNDCGDDKFVETCTYGCEGNACITCTPQSYHACDDGDIYWYNSCAIREGVKESCTYGCDTVTDTCNPDPCISACTGKECGNGGVPGCNCGSCSGTDICENGSCVCYDPSYDRRCKTGTEEVWEYNDCGQSRYVETCQYGCSGGVCIICDPAYDYYCNGDDRWRTSECDGNEFVQTCPYGCSGGVCDTCDATTYWSPASMSNSKYDPSSGVTINSYFNSNGANTILFRVCKGSGIFGADPIHVEFFEGMKLWSYIIDSNFSVSGSSCIGWQTINTSSWDNGDGFGGDIRVVSPASCATQWNNLCSNSPGCGYCWFIQTNTMYRTCKE